jgi:hypothetical protein
VHTLPCHSRKLLSAENAGRSGSSFRHDEQLTTTRVATRPLLPGDAAAGAGSPAAGIPTVRS